MIILHIRNGYDFPLSMPEDREKAFIELWKSAYSHGESNYKFDNLFKRVKLKVGEQLTEEVPLYAIKGVSIKKEVA